MQLDDYRLYTAALTQSLADDPRVLGLIALGSMAEQDYLPDQWSDHDFFVVTIPGQQEAFRTDLLIWSAIVKSTWAGAKGGLGALGLVKEAKAKLEIAIKQDPKALEGSAYTSLGSLYYQVPGWPVGFGDDEKAEKLLKQALAINPTGIDPNFFYGDFLLDQGDKAQAKVYLDKALAAPARPGREVADEGRRMEIRERLAKL